MRVGNLAHYFFNLKSSRDVSPDPSWAFPSKKRPYPDRWYFNLRQMVENDPTDLSFEKERNESISYRGISLLFY